MYIARKFACNAVGSFITGNLDRHTVFYFTAVSGKQIVQIGSFVSAVFIVHDIVARNEIFFAVIVERIKSYIIA